MSEGDVHSDHSPPSAASTYRYAQHTATAATAISHSFSPIAASNRMKK